MGLLHFKFAAAPLVLWEVRESDFISMKSCCMEYLKDKEENKYFAIFPSECYNLTSAVFHSMFRYLLIIRRNIWKILEQYLLSRKKR
ncbi:hypothetical protein SAMN02745217_02985 [Anaerocolumna xylanovorans DSM 12503]|uniref:Uncharacterized protein n=1 Tax=Anaerocolumna xylanovorans DSM 12503 TaxID=1121345 RepID=A0A1M7YEE7_9FIRM|nr:hypothetical protein SAMN02745217_02985 [Anaerocolumna xylanovorans DSM 12503]